VDNAELQPPAGRHWPKALAGFLVLVGGIGVAGYYALDSWLHKESRASEARLREAEKIGREVDEFVKLRDEALLLNEITVRNGYGADPKIRAEIQAEKLKELEARERARQARKHP
jgi:hypothetical protein